MAFADGALNETAYRSRLKRLKKEESDLLKCRHNFDPAELDEMISLGIHIDMVKEVLSKGSLLVRDFGIFGELGGMYSLADFDALDEGDGKLTERDSYRFEMTDMVTEVLEGYDDPHRKREMIKINQRAILQFFNIRVIIYPERLEIKGIIPTQILDKINKQGKESASIITSPSPQGEGEDFFQRGFAPLGLPL